MLMHILLHTKIANLFACACRFYPRRTMPCVNVACAYGLRCCLRLSNTGTLTLPRLFEPQLYSMVVIAFLANGVTSTVDFYVEAVDGIYNEPPFLKPVRVPPVFFCGEVRVDSTTNTSTLSSFFLLPSQ